MLIVFQSAFNAKSPQIDFLRWQSDRAYVSIRFKRKVSSNEPKTMALRIRVRFNPLLSRSLYQFRYQELNPTPTVKFQSASNAMPQLIADLLTMSKDYNL